MIQAIRTVSRIQNPIYHTLLCVFTSSTNYESIISSHEYT